MYAVFLGIIAIITLIILLVVGIQIMTQFDDTVNCNELEGSNYNPDRRNTKEGKDRGDKGWAKACFNFKQDIRDSYNLTYVAIIIIAAVILLSTVTLFGRTG